MTRSKPEPLPSRPGPAPGCSDAEILAITPARLLLGRRSEAGFLAITCLSPRQTRIRGWPARAGVLVLCLTQQMLYFNNMPAKEILAAIRELEVAGWRIQITSSRAYAYARAYCPGGPDGCPPLTIYGTPRVPENEATKIRRALARCEHTS